MTAHKRGLGLAEIATYCDSKSGSLRTRPFGPEPLVFKVAGRMFALLGHLDGNEVVSLKCAPDRSAVLRTSFRAIVPGYHLNKEYWNTLVLDGSVPAPLVMELIDHSYDLAKHGLESAKRERLPPATRSSRSRQSRPPKSNR